MEPIRPKLCPSANPNMPGSVVFAVVTRHDSCTDMGYLRHTIDPVQGTLPSVHPALPTEVFRFAAPCAGHQCGNFDADRCSLADRIREHLAAVAERAPPCAIRKECVWWHQQGVQACTRCPQIITTNFAPSAAEIAAAGAHAAISAKSLPSN
jgi:hypothetical protein